MAMIGNPLIYSRAPSYINSGNGTTTAFTLSWIPGSDSAIIVAVSGLLQKPSVDYTVNSNVVTFASPPATSAPITMYGIGVLGTVNVPADASVTSEKSTATSIRFISQAPLYPCQHYLHFRTILLPTSSSFISSSPLF